MKAESSRKVVWAASIALIGAMLVASSFASPAFANTYNTGYSDTTTVSKGNGVSGRHDFSGTTTATRSGFLASVFSVATFASTSATAPTGWVHQQAVTLDDTTNNLEAWYNVWSFNGCQDCPTSFDIIGTHGTGNSNVDFTYTLMTVDSTQVHYYYEPKTIGGAVTSHIEHYTKSSDSDPSNAFSIGTKIKTFGTTNPKDYKFKYFQFGVESDIAVTQTYKVKQYDMTSAGKIVSTIAAKSAEPNAGNDELNESWSTYSPTGLVLKVACCDYTNADSDANFDTPSIPKGTMNWKKGTMTPFGTQLWT